MSAPAIESVSRSRRAIVQALVRRVCLVTEAAGGGVGRHFLDLAGGLGERGIEVVAIYSPGRCDASFRERRETVRGVEFVELPMRRAVGPFDVVDCVRLADRIRKLGPFDVVHGHSSKGGALARLAARWLGIPCLYTPHAFVTLDPTLSALKRRIYWGVEHWLARTTAAIIAVSEDEATHACELGIDSSKVHVVHNGLEPLDFPPRDDVRSKLALAMDDFVVGFVGRLTKQKAPELLIEALAALVRQQPKAKLVMVGSGPLEADVRQQVEQLGLESHVLMLGDVVGTTILPAFDVFCLCSRYEGLPYVLLEALAAELPIVATRVGGAVTCVEAEMNGLIVETGDAGELTAALARLAADPPLRRRFAAGSADRAGSFTVSRMVDETLALYQRVTAARAGRLAST